MSTFIAKIRTREGLNSERVIQAPDRATAVSQILSEGVLLISLRQKSESADSQAPRLRGFSLFHRHPKSLDIEFGLQQLASMLRSGLSLLNALQTAGEQARTRTAGKVWEKLSELIETGMSLSEAMKKVGCFDIYTLALVEVGEQSGELDATLTRAAENMSQMREMRSMLVNALIYPILVVLMTIGVVGLMVVRVIPQIEGFLSQSNQALPALTQWLLDFSLLVRTHAPMIATILIAIPIIIFLIRRTAVGREQVDRLALYLPVTGNLLRLSRTAVVARGLSILLDSGLPLLDSLHTVTILVRNQRLVRRLKEARDAVSRGESLAHAFSAAPEFMPMLAKMMAVGESTGMLGSTLAEIARFHESVMQNMIQRLGTLIEPVLIIFVGTIVGVVYTAFFLALFSVATTAS